MIDNKWGFEEAYASFQPKIHRYLMQLIGNRDAEDLTQEIFIKVGKALPSFRNESQLSTWIYRIATNAAIDKMRNPSFRRESINEQQVCSLITADHTEILEEEACLSVKTLSIEEQAVRKETSECIRGIIEKLPEIYRMVVILSKLEGLQNKEIAEILNLSLDVVKIRLYRGKNLLKKELLNHCNFYWDERNELTCDPKVLIKKSIKSSGKKPHS